ncbi:MAG: glycosyltransferase [Anaerolineae bacterium]
MMDANPLKQLQIARSLLNPIFTEMGLEVLEATRYSDVLMTVEFGAALLFDVLHANKLKTILINPAPINPTREFATAMPPAPQWFPFPQWYNRMTYTMLERITWSVVGGPRNEIVTKHLGLPKSNFAAYRDMLAATPALTTVSKHVVQRPADWGKQFQVTGYLFDDDPNWQPPQDLSDFLAAGDPPVYIGFGSMPDSKPQATTRMIIDAVHKTGKRAVILTGWARLAADNLPSNIHILKYAPHSWLFPRMAAVVHHGGSGTTASGLRAGVPTTIVPHNGDQPYWGRRVVELGVGTKPIPRKKLTADNLAAAIIEATSNQAMRERAQELGKKIETEDGVGEAVKAVQQFLGL